MSEINTDLNEVFEETMQDAEVITVPIDDTLTHSNEAADAAAVGAALALKADKSEVSTISVNGQRVKTISVNSGGWQKVGTSQLKVTLQKGRNTIRLSNASNWMPDIDYMELVADKPSAINDIHYKPLNDNRCYDLQGRPSKKPAKTISPSHIVISNGKKTIQ